MTFPKGIGYFAGIRSTKDGVNFCAGTLIGPSHVLTRTSCIVGNIRWVSLGSTSSQGNKDGEQIKVVVLLPHPNNTAFHNDYLILELAEETTLKPVRLDSAISIVKPGMKGSRLGWKDVLAEAVEAPHLQGAGVQFVSNELCATELMVDDTNLCSRGVSGVKSCLGDKAGAVIVKDKNHDVLVGYVSQTTGCGKAGGMSVYSRISAVRPWIDSIIKGYCVS
uniref:Peptidase S1 domain-containing protein n=1 Tax=Hyaloperonospora arabidopsidis (strain Emoy2) TaxID=559515 RepID=M4BK08_HYAAE